MTHSSIDCILPEKWQMTTLGFVCDLINGDRGKNYPGRKSLSKEGVPFVNAGDLQDGTISTERLGFIPASTFDMLRSGKFRLGDILFCIRGSLGKVAFNSKIATGGIASSLIIVRPTSLVIPKYIFYYLASPLAHGMIQKFDNGTAQPNLSGADLAKFEIPVPGFHAQERIVAKIEELFSELDKGVESLTTAREQLNVYRQAVLKHAFEGRLTKDWRARNKLSVKEQGQVENAIRADQAHQHKSDLEAWQRTVETWRARSGNGAMAARPENHAQATALVGGALNGLHNLPNGWAYFKVSTICSVVRGGSPRPAGDPKYYDGAIPFLKVADVTHAPGMFLSTHTFSIKEAGLSKTRMTPPQTLLISNSGATLGVPKICTFEATFNDGIAAFLGLPQPYLRFVYYFLESKTAELRAVNQGAAQPNLNTSILGEMIIPLCTKDEADALVQMLDMALAESRRLLAEIDLRLSQAQVLRLSILKRAFSGQLVAQDPKDEPASALLERIQTKREQQTSRQPCDGKSKKKEAA
jgi:type I restriction enzyme S subunit